MENTLWKLRKFTLTEKKIREITYLAISLVKLLLSRNFCQKCVRVNSRNFHTVEKVEILSSSICFVKSTLYITSSSQGKGLPMLSQNFFQE